MRPSEILEHARTKVDHPSKWCFDHWEKDGRLCAEWAVRAVCIEAKVIGASGDRIYNEYDLALRHLSREMQGNTIRFEYRHSHSEVLAAFDRAILRAKRFEGNLRVRLAYSWYCTDLMIKWI